MTEVEERLSVNHLVVSMTNEDTLAIYNIIVRLREGEVRWRMLDGFGKC
jgi:hypothetical protein